MRISDWSSDVCSSDLDPALDNADLGIEEKSPLQLFNETLERSIISRLASAASSKIVNADGQFVPGNLETDSFLISIVDLGRSEEHTSELQSLMRISYAVFCLKKNKIQNRQNTYRNTPQTS